MIEVSFVYDNRGRMAAVRAFGHADFGDSEYDLVCSAVSAILQAARLGLEQHARVELDATQQSGELDMVWPADARDDAAVAAIVRTAELAVRQIAGQYPNHIRCNTVAESG